MERRDPDPPLERLLHHRAWLRALAARLVGATAADDLVQETWLAALRRPPDPGRPPRPWLATVARRLAGRTRRSAPPRPAEVGDKGLPSAAELIERIDTEKRLASEVARLDEPFRTTLLLRYYEGLSSAEIARRQGVPDGTVRWRLKRGLELMRERLDGAFGDRRSRHTLTGVDSRGERTHSSARAGNLVYPRGQEVAMIRSLPLAIALLAPLASGDLHVPGDYADLQDAITSASPGEVIFVHGGTHGPITIHQSVQIVGDPAPLIVGKLHPLTLQWRSPIALAGPGNGTVILARMNIGRRITSGLAIASAPGIAGGGFFELRVLDARVRAPEWSLPLLTGLGVGEPAIETSVPYVVIERCFVKAGNTGSDDTLLASGPPGAAGIRAPASDVLVLDSTVEGGGVDKYVHTSVLCGGYCPDGGEGGVGIDCDRLFHAGSTILGGKGGTWLDALQTTVCCTKPHGAPTLTNLEVQLGDDLVGSGPMILGGSYTFTWTTSGPLLTLFLSHGLTPPLPDPLGWSFLPPSDQTAIGPLVAPGSLTVTIPGLPGLAGLPANFQGADVTSGLTRPVLGVLLP